MRKFYIKVNGKSYEVEVEEVSGNSSVSFPQTVPSPMTAPLTVSIPQENPAQEAPKPVIIPTTSPVSMPADATNISAPMPGTILDINVAIGDSVKDSDVLLILEAMKMENEILAPKAGKIVAIQVVKGSSVNTGDILVSIS